MEGKIIIVENLSEQKIFDICEKASKECLLSHDDQPMISAKAFNTILKELTL